ncbi:MAG: sortase [Patescibacteria group bacterium]
MNKKTLFRSLAVVFLILGVSILGYVYFPIIQYEITKDKSIDSFLSPVPNEYLNSYLFKKQDLTKASNWFVGGAKEKDFSASKISFYTISIPKLKINRAVVAVGGEDLSKSLIHYPGTAIPGKKGNAVIFGHSTLPQFFNPENYLSIFSTLPTLSRGDEISIDYDGVNFKYSVEDMIEILPTDIEVLAQNPSDAFLSLVTCVPPGHPLKPKRLVVRARIVPLTQAGDLK